MPLVQHLTNGQFVQELDNLVKASGQSVPVQVRAPREMVCRCGCRERVNQHRKFVNQEHYNVWLSRERFVGRHLRHGS